MCELRMWPRKHFGMHCNSSLNCYYVASQLNTNIKILAENSFFFQAFFTLSKQNTQNTQTNLFTFWRENCGIFGRFPFCFTQPSNSQDWARLSKMSIATFFAILLTFLFMNFLIKHLDLHLCQPETEYHSVALFYAHPTLDTT